MHTSRMTPNKMTPGRITLLALFTTISLAIYYVESLLPPLVPLPGIKLGLANIISLILIKNASFRDAFFVLLTRILLSALLFGQAMSFLYSLAGGICSLIAMYLINRFLHQRYTGLTGIFGALFHNLGQLAMAILIVSSPAPLAYLPFFTVCSIITGLFTGLCAHFASKHLRKLSIF